MNLTNDQRRDEWNPDVVLRLTREDDPSRTWVLPSGRPGHVVSVYEDPAGADVCHLEAEQVPVADGGVHATLDAKVDLYQRGLPEGQLLERRTRELKSARRALGLVTIGLVCVSAVLVLVSVTLLYLVMQSVSGGAL